MKTKPFGIVALGASLFLVGGCSGSAFTTFEGESGLPGEDRDASVEAGPFADGGGKDAETAAEAGTDASSQDADSSDGDADVEDDADADSDADIDDAAPEDGGEEEEAGESDASDGGLEEACTPITWYRDDDGDGYGAESVVGCAPPTTGTWVIEGGDCHDGNAEVHPGQAAYFAVPYAIADGSGQSFDYDCDGKETNEGTPKKTTGCSVLDGLCSGEGYLPNSPARPGGANINQQCGSTKYLTCSWVLLVCSEKKSDYPVLRCR